MPESSQPRRQSQLSHIHMQRVVSSDDPDFDNMPQPETYEIVQTTSVPTKSGTEVAIRPHFQSGSRISTSRTSSRPSRSGEELDNDVIQIIQRNFALPSAEELDSATITILKPLTQPESKSRFTFGKVNAPSKNPALKTQPVSSSQSSHAVPCASCEKSNQEHRESARSMERALSVAPTSQGLGRVFSWLGSWLALNFEASSEHQKAVPPIGSPLVQIVPVAEIPEVSSAVRARQNIPQRTGYSHMQGQRQLKRMSSAYRNVSVIRPHDKIMVTKEPVSKQTISPVRRRSSAEILPTHISPVKDDALSFKMHRNGQHQPDSEGTMPSSLADAHQSLHVVTNRSGSLRVTKSRRQPSRPGPIPRNAMANSKSNVFSYTAAELYQLADHLSGKSTEGMLKGCVSKISDHLSKFKPFVEQGTSSSEKSRELFELLKIEGESTSEQDHSFETNMDALNTLVEQLSSGIEKQVGKLKQANDSICKTRTEAENKVVVALDGIKSQCKTWRDISEKNAAAREGIAVMQHNLESSKEKITKLEADLINKTTVEAGLREKIGELKSSKATLESNKAAAEASKGRVLELTTSENKLKQELEQLKSDRAESRATIAFMTEHMATLIREKGVLQGQISEITKLLEDARHAAPDLSFPSTDNTLI